MRPPRRLKAVYKPLPRLRQKLPFKHPDYQPVAWLYVGGAILFLAAVIVAFAFG